MPSHGPDDAQIARMLRLLADQAQAHAILLTDPAGRIVWVNPGARRLFGLSETQALDEPLSVIFTAEDRAHGIAGLEQEVAASAALSEDDRWHERIDGSRFWSSGALIALRDEQQNLLGFGKILRDRTDMKTQLESLRNSLAHAEAQMARTTDAVSKVAHEMRNVYAGIYMGMGMLDKHGVSQLPQVAELMRQQLEVVERLTEDLLESRRLDAGQVSLALREVSVQRSLTNVYMQMQDRFLAKSLEVQMLLPPGPLVVCADEVRLHQIFVNLVDNAIKYTPGGGRIWMKATMEDRDAVIHVEDTGRGIPPDMLTRIFELFTQVEPGASHGLGIGLNVVYELVRMHGGSVQAYSKGADAGSVFTVRLPLAHVEEGTLRNRPTEVGSTS